MFLNNELCSLMYNYSTPETAETTNPKMFEEGLTPKTIHFVTQYTFLKQLILHHNIVLKKK